MPELYCGAFRSAVFVMSQSIAAMIEMESMRAANQERQHKGEYPAYAESEFVVLIEKYGLGHNAVLNALNGGGL